MDDLGSPLVFGKDGWMKVNRSGTGFNNNNEGREKNQISTLCFNADGKKHRFRVRRSIATFPPCTRIERRYPITIVERKSMDSRLEKEPTPMLPHPVQPTTIWRNPLRTARRTWHFRVHPFLAPACSLSQGRNPPTYSPGICACFAHTTCGRPLSLGWDRQSSPQDQSLEDARP